LVYFKTNHHSTLFGGEGDEGNFGKKKNWKRRHQSPTKGEIDTRNKVKTQGENLGLKHQIKGDREDGCRK